MSISSGASLKEKTIKSLFFKLSEQFFLNCSQLLISIVLARLLSPKEYALVGLMAVFGFIASAVFETGFCSGVVQKRELTENDSNTAFCLCVISSITLYICFFLFAPLFALFYKNSSLCFLLRIYALSIIPGSVISFYNSILSREFNYTTQFISSVISAFGAGAIGIYLAYSGKGVWALIIQYMSNRVLYLLIIAILSRIKPRLKISVQSAKEIISFSWKMSARRILGVTVTQLRSLIIGKIYSENYLGYYTKGQMIPVTVTTAIDHSLQSVLFSTYSRKQDDVEQLKQVVRRSMQVSSYILFPMLIGIVSIAPQLVESFLTSKWLPAVPFMQIACLYCMFHPINSANAQAINALGRSDITLKIELYYRLASFAIIVISSMFNIYVFASCAIIDISIIAILYIFVNRRFLSYKIKEQLSDIIPNLLQSIVMGVLVYSISLLSFGVSIILVLQILFGSLIWLIFSIITQNKSFIYFIETLRNIYYNISKKNFACPPKC